jgi:polysaccharide chain length determinant protein (PEP-CTERM system associated)
MPRDMLSTAQEDSAMLRSLEILRRRKMVALVVFAVVFASAVTFALYLPNLYRATSVVLVERPVSETFVRAAVTGELESRLHVIKQEILSRARLSDLITRYNLYPELRRGGQIDAALEQMRRDVVVEPTGPEMLSGKIKTVAFNLSYTGELQHTVADVANEIAAFYVAQNDAIRSGEAVKTTQFLKSQLDEAKRQLDVHEGRIRAYTSAHNGELPQQVDMNLATLERLNTQLRLISEQQIRTLEQRQRLMESIPMAGPATGMSASDSPTSDLLEQKKQALSELESRVTSKHPDVVRLKQEIAALETIPEKPREATPQDAMAAGQARGRAAVLANLDAELEKQKREEASLRATIAATEQKLESMPTRQQDYALIKRDHDAAQELYNSLLTKYGEAQVAESMEAGRSGERFRVMEAAIPPNDPSAPNRLRLLMMGFIVALVLAFVAILAVEQFDTTFHNIDELRSFTRVPVLASIPRMYPKPVTRILRTAAATGCLAAVLFVVVTLSIRMAQDNEQLVRLLIRG